MACGLPSSLPCPPASRWLREHAGTGTLVLQMPGSEIRVTEQEKGGPGPAFHPWEWEKAVRSPSR
jgi:hypothetical protein